MRQSAQEKGCCYGGKEPGCCNTPSFDLQWLHDCCSFHLFNFLMVEMCFVTFLQISEKLVIGFCQVGVFFWLGIIIIRLKLTKKRRLIKMTSQCSPSLWCDEKTYLV